MEPVPVASPMVLPVVVPTFTLPPTTAIPFQADLVPVVEQEKF